MSGPSDAAIVVDAGRIERRLDALSGFTERERPYTRRAFTELYLEARDWLQGEFEAAGLTPRLDAGANLVGGRAGADPAASPLAIGSHIDTVPSGGRFDGIAGVLVALEAAQALHEAGARLRHPLRVYDFLSEEPSEYGASCVGSRALVGTLDEAMLAGTAPSGESLAEAIVRMGGRPNALAEPIERPGGLAAFLELHIEQGPYLEREGIPLGVVEGIVSIRRMRLRIEGEAAHAGTTPMQLRRDALVGAAPLATWVQQRAIAYAEAAPFVATVGRWQVEPNGANVVPGAVEMIVEARALEEGRVARFLEELVAHATTLLEGSGLALKHGVVSTAPPAQADSRLVEALERACVQRDYRYARMVSGAGHDAMQVARVAPMAMLFVPCVGGLSHNPAEMASVADLAAGAEVMADALVDLDVALP